VIHEDSYFQETGIRRQEPGEIPKSKKLRSLILISPMEIKVVIGNINEIIALDSERNRVPAFSPVF
jgi:hypothetical protein